MKDVLRQPAALSWADYRNIFKRFVERRRPLLATLVVLAVAVGVDRARDGASEGTQEESVVAVLARDGLLARPDGILWLEDEEGGPFDDRPALLIARREGEADDLYYAEIRPGDDGSVLDVAWVTNITRTSGAEEQPPIRSGDYALYVSRVRDRFDAVTVIDLRGEPDEVTADWPRRARMQNSITNLQETGRMEGFGRRRYVLSQAATEVDVAVDGSRFVVVADGERIVFDPTADEPAEGGELVELRPMVKGQPGTLTWVVDTVRNHPWVGPEPIEWLEHRVFGVKDWFERNFVYAVVDADTEEEVAAEMGLTEEERRRRLELSVTDAEIGWPPHAIPPILDEEEPIEGEGQWIAIVDDPFVATYENAPPAFYTTFIRADPERAYTRIYATVWDPRLAQLRIMTGTREPESATGETGPGMAPREPETLERMVAGFNGGFQALHGEFGMMSDGRVYLPPKPWAATVAVHRDGSVSMGSWTDPPEGQSIYLERWAVEQIPDDMVDMRQNLTSIVEGDTWNPWERWWWGAAPRYAQDQTYIERSALCLTEEGFMIYFWGRSMGPEALGQAMLAARCVRGMHLDMNSRHTGFEFYDVHRRSDPFPPLGRAMTDAEYEGPIEDGGVANDYVIRARKMVSSMTPMRFPRYINRDPRDFFYLTLTPRLPGPHLADEQGAEGAGEFSVAGLPHAGFPYAFARAFLGGGDGQRTWLVRIDPSRAVAAPMATEAHRRPLAYLTNARALATQSAPHALYAVEQSVGHRFAVGAPPDGATVLVAGPPLGSAPDATAAIGVDREGFLLYLERQPEDAQPLSARARHAGVREAVALPDGVRLAFSVDGAFVAPDRYERHVDVAEALPLFAEEAPRTRILFPDTEPRAYRFWRTMQDTRVRYFREGAPTFSRGGRLDLPTGDGQ